MRLKKKERERETKDEPQTNGSYKIKHIIVKIMGYTLYIYTNKQSQNSPSEIKYSRLIQRTKEIKKLYLSVKNKTS